MMEVMGRLLSSRGGAGRNVIVAMLILLLPGSLNAQEASAPPDWICSRCMSTEGWELDIKAGSAYVSDDDYEFGDYTGLDDAGVYLYGDMLALYRDKEGRYVNFDGFRYGPDAATFFFEGGRQGAYELRASYQSIPRRLYNSTATPYAGSGGSDLSLPAVWVRAPNTGQMTSLDTSLSPIRIELDWDVYGLGVDYKPATNWKLRMDYTRRERNGQSRSSGSFLFNAVEFVQPVDYTSDDLQLEVLYGTDRWQTSLTYYGSFFSNKDGSLQWDNPYTSAAGADRGQTALAPDNESHRVSLAASLLLPAQTTLSGQVSYGHMTQNEDLLPYTTNGLLGAGALPTDSANAEVDTLNVDLRVVTSPTRKLSLEGELRYNDFDNKTAENIYNYVNTDSVLLQGSVRNIAYDYKRRDLRLRSEYRLNSALRLEGGFNTERFDRERQDRSRTTTDRLWVGLHSRLGTGADVDVEAFVENRGGSDYSTVVNPAAQENPLMRKYNMADRERQGIRLRASSYRVEGVDFGWEFEYSQDDYANSTLGFTETEYVRFGADVSVLLGENTSVYTSVYNETMEIKQANSQGFSASDWTAQTDDRFTTATAGMTRPELIGPIDAKLEYSWSQGVGKIRNDTSGLPGRFPDLRSKRQTLSAGLVYPYSDSLSFGLDYFFESLDTSDWAVDNVAPDTIPNLLALGADPWNYNASVIYLSVRYLLRPR